MIGLGLKSLAPFQYPPFKDNSAFIGTMEDIYIHVDRKAFKIARFICDAIQGTEDVNRPVEDKTLTREPKDIVFYNRESHTMIHVNRQALFWNDVKQVRAILDKDGNYQGLSKPQEIANAIVMSGISWVSCKKVKYAQKQLHSTNCRREIV